MAPLNNFLCERCGQTFSRIGKLYIHQEKPVQCPLCKEQFCSVHILRKHRISSCFETSVLNHCPTCGGVFSSRRNLKSHRCFTTTPQILGVIKESVRGKFKIIELASDYTTDFDSLLQVNKDSVSEHLKSEFLEGGALKYLIEVHIQFQRKQATEIQYVSAWFKSKMNIYLNISDFNSSFDEAVQKITQQVDNYTKKGSGWSVNYADKLLIKIAKYEPLTPSNYIATPKELEVKKAIINVKNNDFKCYTWSILASRYSVKVNPDRLSNYFSHEHELNMNGIEYPVKLNSISKFESQNNIAVNVFGFNVVKQNKQVVYPLRLSNSNSDEIVNLLLLHNEEKSHYCLIKHFNRLFRNLKTNKTYFCVRCLHCFSSQDRLTQHKTLCTLHQECRIRLPEIGKHVLKFENYRFQLKVPFTIYADFESFLVPVKEHRGNKTEVIQNHVPSGFAYIIVDSDGNVIQTQRYLDLAGENNTIDIFLNCLLDDYEILSAILNLNVPMTLNNDDHIKIQQATSCGICKKSFVEGDERVLDHCHLTGEFRYVAHSYPCNINYKLANHIPIFFHNLRHYDAHLIIQKLGSVKPYWRMNVIAKSEEQYISFSWGQFRFLDSMAFLSASLETLSNNLESEKLIITKGEFPNCDLNLLKKGIFPYEYMNSHEKFSETQLPPKEAFFSTLKNESISDENYTHAQKVWKQFNIQNLGEYQSLYNLTDVLLLADVFENFRNICMDNYDLDPNHFYTLPGVSFSACLKLTQVELELLTDINMHLFVEQSIRGGMSMISQRFALANNIYMNKDYNPNEKSTYIMYFDANNLYATSMVVSLPYKNFRWLNEKEISKLDVLKVRDDAQEGYFLEVDLEYPKELHDLHNEYPLACEHMVVSTDMLSSFAKELAEKLELKSNCKKLIPNLNNKTNYILHYRNLKQYLSLGLVLTKVHRVLAFHQKPWLKPYIELNTNKRKLAKNTFEKDFFKLMNNSVFGKTCENKRKHVRIELVANEKRAKRIIANPALQNFQIISEYLAMTNLKKVEVELNRPLYVGATVLDNSKILMYDFHYNFMKPKYGENCKLLFTDTDSLMYHIGTDDIFKDLKPHCDLFDFSDYPVTHPLYSLKNKKVIGKFKDEYNSNIIKEFIGLRSKMYSILATENQHKTVGKGITKSVMKNCITHDNYRDALFNEHVQSENMLFIQSRRHQIETIAVNKTTLSPFDDKRYLINNIESYSYGHYKILL